jgi:hypothetical protein
LYGYRDCNNHVYRFYKNITYQIAEPGRIYIYTKEENITQGKGYKVVNVYYFSVSAEGEIIPLTLNNLKSAYRDNKKFFELLSEFFNGNDVNEYDNIHKTFKVNYFYTNAMN